MSSNIAIICLTGTVSVNLFCDISTEAQRGKWVLVFFLVTRFLSLIYLMIFSLLCLWLECKKGRQVKFPFFPQEKKNTFLGGERTFSLLKLFLLMKKKEDKN